MRKPDEVFLCYNDQVNTYLFIDGENFLYNRFKMVIIDHPKLIR
ncbi:MAG: hypothetical protein UY16_C0007G0019 [Candidatus Gottesmanbacteria bacterium GW2011_GWA2_47_9]|uniref:Uncharacterized protein n=1 Tax=Candidatus Gottesmanbacteria bacterium GW2011_GWA2_47_9 TaxID=1618445 RepID=A0A0G1WDM7_9BACT|nr:MAG: hypothetical protein UY16_C0007G0019 [Candidatus Gottesmanbacteria bacterium GW2011_GWA2_47_9]